MNDYPRMLVRYPGTTYQAYTFQDGGKYDTLIVRDDAEHAAMLDDGWFETPPEARKAYEASLQEKLVEAKSAEFVSKKK